MSWEFANTGFGSGSIQSGNIASGAISRFKMASGAINSGHVSSGAVLGSLGGGAFNIASGTVGPNDLGSGAILSGAIASGQIGTNHITSGAIVTYGRNVITNTYSAEETISGVRCVHITRSGNVRIAMATLSGRIPANGIVFTNALSGTLATVVRYGDVLGPSSEFGSGLCFTLRMGRSLWVGSSGQVVVLSGGGPTIGISPTNSGAWGQRIGTSSISGAMLVDIVQGIQYSGAANITTNFLQFPV